MTDSRKPRSVRKLVTLSGDTHARLEEFRRERGLNYSNAMVALIRGAFDARDAQRRAELLNGKR